MDPGGEGNFTSGAKSGASEKLEGCKLFKTLKLTTHKKIQKSLDIDTRD
jgi:hypothetical protein